MSIRSLYFGAAVAVALSQAAAAQTAPQSFGATREAFVPGWCKVMAGPATFRRDGAAAALITLGDIYYAPGGYPNYFKLSGLARMEFDNAQAGRIRFSYANAYPIAVRSPRFANFSQTYDAAQGGLVVSFNVKFDQCRLPVTAIYRDQ